ncbi:hypothetical protein CcaverHIS002_0201550 [Cutaneotrichosporon cavernicola]|uniref:NmrA-like domain-containing protein n=1 Tax=Cutaneotrichosporon cavernicola TaxID=279322 RepID=A0AA48I0D2_9TREE|nr:uncharacterized protein CcaverHIS019_0201580 [Cutaneotrichosporon cavernicola]BEI80995.1 hypothetical protein CcaverHIS002_0201550 [Cutaneotrichosporon cavernicola]BEI88796.1 hypothetical protein CcaverHIS019_0201580 [Cutaneotrichosporon cavernicola]BEI96571.1 hypothetical protein CcaverHIS631_0201600 [Cutaneotrichosporon cavernicola]BEJ04344.1 hypothetical protein CcaverHIS641_0201610 [Cutaneotrichosporon cavernicola]
MTNTKTIVVFGVTGNQGSSTARALLAANYSVVGITRDTTSSKAQALKALGVKLHKADLDAPESYAPALQNAWGVFLNLDYWVHYDGTNGRAAQAKEEAQGRAAVDAIKAAGVQRVVYSTLDSLGTVPHFDSKATIAGYVRDSGVPFTLLYTSYYYSNILSGQIKEVDGGLLLDLGMPDDAVLPSYAVEQTGLWAVKAFEPEWIGKDMYAAGENMSIADIAAALARVTGRNVTTRHVTLAEFEADTTTDREWYVNFVAVVEKRFTRDVAKSRETVPQAWDFDTWAKETGSLDKWRK